MRVTLTDGELRCGEFVGRERHRNNVRRGTHPAHGLPIDVSRGDEGEHRSIIDALGAPSAFRTS
jgi:hypothetical protein